MFAFFALLFRVTSPAHHFMGDSADSIVDCKQSLHKSVEWPAFLRQSYFVTQTNKGGLGRGEKEGTAPVAVTDGFRINRSANLISESDMTDHSTFFIANVNRHSNNYSNGGILLNNETVKH